MNNMLLHVLRFGVSGNSACAPSFIRIEYNTGETVELEGEALLKLTTELTQLLVLIATSSQKKADEPVFDSEDFRSKK